MTREEAIHNLEGLWHEVYNEDSDGYDYAVAIDMAIEALSAERLYAHEEVWADDDLISRKEAIKAICNAQCELDVPHYPKCDQVKWCDDVKALLALPSAEAV